MSRITPQWLDDLGGRWGVASAGGKYWDFPIISQNCQSYATFLRVHESVNDEEWATDLFDLTGQSIGILNWPTTRGKLLKLLDALGCEINGAARRELVVESSFTDEIRVRSKGCC